MRGDDGSRCAASHITSAAAGCYVRADLEARENGQRRRTGKQTAALVGTSMKDDTLTIRRL